MSSKIYMPIFILALLERCLSSSHAQLLLCRKDIQALSGGANPKEASQVIRLNIVRNRSQPLLGGQAWLENFWEVLETCQYLELSHGQLSTNWCALESMYEAQGTLSYNACSRIFSRHPSHSHTGFEIPVPISRGLCPLLIPVPNRSITLTYARSGIQSYCSSGYWIVAHLTDLDPAAPVESSRHL